MLQVLIQRRQCKRRQSFIDMTMIMSKVSFFLRAEEEEIGKSSLYQDSQEGFDF